MLSTSIILDYCVCLFWFLNPNIWTVLSQGFSDRHCRYDFVVSPGIELRDFVLDNIFVSSPNKCALQCLSRSDCMSFNYQDFTELCQLNGASLSCVPDHAVFNGTMRHFSPPTASCMKEACHSYGRVGAHTETCGPKKNAHKWKKPPERNNVRFSPSKPPRKLLKAQKWTFRSGGGPFFIANFPLKSRSVFKIRLTGGKLSSEGRVEIKYDNKWGVIADKKLDIKDADVICRQLKFKNGAINTKPSLVEKAPVETAFAMSDFRCNGDENVIDDCRYKLIESVSGDNITGVEGAGVACVSDIKVLNAEEMVDISKG